MFIIIYNNFVINKCLGKFIRSYKVDLLFKNCFRIWKSEYNVWIGGIYWKIFYMYYIMLIDNFFIKLSIYFIIDIKFVCFLIF